MTLTEEQVQRRLKGIGASEVAAVLGLDPHRTPFDVWLEKTGRATPFAGNQATKLGHMLEPIAAKLYEERVPGVTLHQPDGTIIGAEPWMLATPDRIARMARRPQSLVPRKKWVVELKNRSRYAMADYGNEGTDQIPHRDLVQVTWQQYVSGITEEATLAVLVDGREFLTFRVPFDMDLASSLYHALREWWFTHVVGDKEPDGVPPLDYLSKTLKLRDNKTIQATDAHEELLEDMLSAKRMIEDGKFLLDHAKAKMALLLQGQGGVKGAAGSVSFRERQGQSYTEWKAIATELAERFKIPQGEFASIVDRHSGRKPTQRIMQFRKAKGEEPVGLRMLERMEQALLSSGDDASTPEGET